MTESHKVQARALQRGDLTGSGETIVAVFQGPRIPAGYGKHRMDKVEITLERDGRRRTSIWGAYTLINVRREVKSA